MISHDHLLVICRSDPKSAAGMRALLWKEQELLNTEVPPLRTENAKLRVECQAVRARGQNLEERLVKDSHNYHKLSFSDGPVKPNIGGSES